MRGSDLTVFRSIAATTSGFPVEGGDYVLDVSATFSGGNVGLDRLAADDTTWVPALTALTVAGQSPRTALPRGQYRISVVTATAIYARLQRLPDVG